MHDDAIIAALLNTESAAITYVREKYSREYIERMTNKFDINFNSTHMTYFIEHGEIKNIERTIDEHKCTFCLAEESYAKNTETKLFPFNAPQGNHPKIIDPLLTCDQCLYQLIKELGSGYGQIHMDQCTDCSTAFTVTSDLFENRSFKGTLGKHHCPECLISAGYLDEKYQQDHTCPSCREYEEWDLSLRAKLGDRNKLCASCDILGPHNDDTDIDDDRIGEYPPRVYPEDDNPKPFYHLQKFKETRWGALIYSLEDFRHERLTYDLVRLTDDYQRVDYTTVQYALNHTQDYSRDSSAAIERLMKDVFHALDNMSKKD